MISFVDTKLNCGRYQLWEYILLGKPEVQEIVDFSPSQTLGAGIADPNSFVRKFLYRDVEKLVHLPALKPPPGSGLPPFRHV